MSSLITGPMHPNKIVKVLATEERGVRGENGLFSYYGVTPMPGLPKGYLSVSQVALYHRCARQYFHKYVLGAPQEDSLDMLRGSIIHKFVEKVAASKEKDTSLLIGHKAGAFLEQQLMLNPVPPEKVRAFTEEIRVLLEVLHKSAFLENTIIASEKEIFFTIQDPTTGVTVPVLGYIDLIYHDEAKDKLVIGDFKVTKRTQPMSQVMENFQLWTYSVAEGIDTAALLFLDTVKNTFTVREVTVPPNDRRHCIDILFDTAMSIASGTYMRCTPGEWWCSEKWCSVFKECRGAV